jgi:hypothetical protein
LAAANVNAASIRLESSFILSSPMTSFQS